MSKSRILFPLSIVLFSSTPILLNSCSNSDKQIKFYILTGINTSNNYFEELEGNETVWCVNGPPDFNLVSGSGKTIDKKDIVSTSIMFFKINMTEVDSNTWNVQWYYDDNQAGSINQYAKSYTLKNGEIIFSITENPWS